MQDYYKLLGIPEDASVDEIKKKLRDSQRKWTYAQNGPIPERRYEAEQNLRLVPEIKRVLLTKRERKKYNQLLRKDSAPEQVPAPGPEPSLSDDARSGDFALEEVTRLLVQGRVVDALGTATMLTMLQSDNADAWFLLANCHSRMNNSADAIHACERAIQLESNQANFHFFLGSHYSENGNWPEALKHFQRATEVDPDTPAYRVAVAGAFLKTDDRSGSNVERATELMDECVIQNPDDSSVRNMVAAIYVDAAQASWDYLVQLDRYVPTTPEQIKHAEAMLDKANALDASEQTPYLNETKRTIADSKEKAFDGNWLAVIFVPIFWGMMGGGLSLLYGFLFSFIYGITSVSLRYNVWLRMLKKQRLYDGPFAKVLVYAEVFWGLFFFIPLRILAAILAMALRIRSESIDRAFDKMDSWLAKDGLGYKVFQKFSSAIWICLSSPVPIVLGWKFMQNREEVLTTMRQAREIAIDIWNRASEEIKKFKSKDLTS